MPSRMLIDCTQPEETRVVVHSGTRIEDFDYETDTRKQLKGNIYLAKVTRVEPSLQAAFVDYGGNRHGFLPFSEIHPDYYRIPISDREELLAAEGAALREEEDFDEPETEEDGPREQRSDAPAANGSDETEPSAEVLTTDDAPGEKTDGDEDSFDPAEEEEGVREVATEEKVDSVGGDETEDAEKRRTRLLRRYKIQEVIKRRQILLVQVTKEERGNKGAALTTYLSLAGRYCVLMPNTNKGGGISRKISNPNDRRRLKKMLADLEIPQGIAIIVRTAGSQRSKAEIRRDYEYLMRLWNEIRETTFQSTAPALIYEEANLIKRAIRDLYTREMDEVLVDGEDGYKAAKAFMKSLMPSHAKKVRLYKDGDIALFQEYQVERQLEAMHSPIVRLRSGGYIVLSATEALVAIDVNSGKATRERNIEETAVRTNVEAAEEIGRQLRLRDLAGLIVIDFIDMEDARHNREVERKLKDALRHDRARIQLGRISPFGLLEMSRQRLRPSLFESSTTTCPHCHGSGFVRTTESVALQILRVLEEEAIRRKGGVFSVTAPTEIALYLLNQKRSQVVGTEARHGVTIQLKADDALPVADIVLEIDGERIPLPSQAVTEGLGGSAEGGSPRKGRRRRGRKKTDSDKTVPEAVGAEETESKEPEAIAESGGAGEADEDGKSQKRRRRGKRGGRRRGSRSSETADTEKAASAHENQTQNGDASESAADTRAAEPGEEGESPGAKSDAAAKPKRAPRRRRRKSEEPEQASDGSASAVAGQGESPPTEPIAPGPAKAEEKRKRPRRRRPSAGAASNKEADPEAKGSNDSPAPAAIAGTVVSESIIAAPRPSEEDPSSVQQQPAMPTDPQPTPLSEAENVERIASANESKARRPKRRGWWNRSS